jgi:uncharacterized membrane protein
MEGTHMRSPANIAGHPIHPLLVTLPIGVFVFSFVCDLIYVFGSGNPTFAIVALYTMAGGIVGALAAAIFGFIDLLSLPPEPRKTGLAHMTINLIVVVLYVINYWLRRGTPESPGGYVWLSLIAIALLVVAGWLGGKMVYVYGVAVSGVDEKTSVEEPRPMREPERRTRSA